MPLATESSERVDRGRLVAAFAAVYVFWSTTYLAIRIAIETIPPFVMVGVRFLIAGAVLYLWARRRGHPRVTAAEWKTAAITGLLTLGIGNTAVVWAEQRVPSGTAALLAAIVPLWMVLVEWMMPGGQRPRATTMAGLGLGLVGLIVLIGPGMLLGHSGSVDPLAALVLICGSAAWAVGSIFNRHGVHASAQMSTALQMLAAGAAVIALSLASGEMWHVHPAEITARSLLGLGYLIVFGSLVGFSAYVFMVRSTSVARASTYAYVNPLVALFLGWWLMHEPVTRRTLVGAAVILAGVAVITLASGGVPDADMIPVTDT